MATRNSIRISAAPTAVAFGPGQPQLHHRQQAVPPGKKAGLGPVALEQRDGVIDARGALVFDRRGNLHNDPLRGVSASTLSPAAAAVNGRISVCLSWPCDH